ncbi:hypothetical protein CDO52_12815 [Nocardiopsis gilva YIM 90087]|uniref:Uncharacterized protein n=1 Tax=Nocardiopsis gilva YIM 90087 TaxID=1235441 RepID=A0A223S623_9ACTN|nr:hypothetical protein [Nocardiopsis gilva]ASU83551.1 hypothetical protein CDO52_12815 [Nocardiopsis gilva YIM 90087]
MPTVRFESRTATAKRRVKCSGGCGKTLTRQRTFMQTISPFNRDPGTGLPRTAEQVQEAVNREADAWQPQATCTNCDTDH